MAKTKRGKPIGKKGPRKPSMGKADFY